MNVHVNLQLILLLAFITNCLQFTLYGQLSDRYNPDKKHEMMGGMVGIDQTLATLLRNISTSELESCFLTILYDRIYETTVTLSSLVTLPNFKQLYQIENLNDINGILWKDKACKAYIFLLDDHSKLFDLAAHSKAWNYQGKYIIATKGKEQFISFLKSDKGKNSEFVAGIVLSRNKSKWVIYTREFFPKLQLLPFPNFDTSKKIFNEKFKNFKGATIKVCNFEMEPSVIFYREKGKPIYRYGRDIELVKALAEALHFQIEFVEPPNNEFWGVLLENGSYTGMIGKVIRGEVDIGAANAYIGRLDEIMDYSTTYDYTPACFLAPIPQPLPQWQSILRPFNLDSWIFILVIAATSFALLCVVAYRSSRRNRHNLKPGLECLLLTIRLHCRESTNIRANVGNHKVFLLFLSIYCLIVTIAYSSNLTAFLTVPQQPKSIETISELVDSKMAVNEVIPYYSCYMAESSDTLLRKLSKQMVTYDDFKRAMAVVSKGTAFYIENKPYIEYLYALNFTSGGASQFRIMKECLSSFQIVLYLGKHTPIRKTINDVINRIIEAGLVKKWLIDAIIQAKQFKRASQDNFSQKVISVDVDVEYKNKNLSLNHLQGIFWILIVGQLVAITVFAIEKSGRWVAQQEAQRATFIVEQARQERQQRIVYAEGEAEAAKKVGEAIGMNGGYLKLRKITAAKNIGRAISNSQNKVYLGADNLMLNLTSKEFDDNINELTKRH